MSWAQISRNFPLVRRAASILLKPRSWSSTAKPAKFDPVTAGKIGKNVAPLPPPTLAAEAKDVIMFRYDNPRFFRLLSAFSITQFGLWLALCSSSFSLIDTPVKKEENVNVKEKEKEADLPFWRSVNLGQDKYKYGMAAGSFLMGYCILVCSWTYILRSVRYLILRKDRKHVSFVTYTPFGQNRIMDVPLHAISAAGSRTSGTSQMPVKVKNRWLFYIVDLKKGEFPQPKLFDQTVGMQRKF